MRVLVTGSRTWTDVSWIGRELVSALINRGSGPLTLIHGDARRGADRIADQWGIQYQALGNSIEIERHPANWKLYGSRAGMIRNREMVQAGADLCLAFIQPCNKPACQRPQPHDSHGAAHCVELAEKAGIPVRGPFRSYGGRRG